MATIFDKFETKDDGSGLITRNTIEKTINTTTYTASDMKSGTAPICDKKSLTGITWTFTAEELPVTVRYALTNPIIQYVDKSQMPVVNTYNDNTLFVDSPVAPSSFTASLPTTDDIAKEFTLTPLNLWIGTTKANLLKNGDIELILNVAAPARYNTHITTLPESCRPKANKTVLGMNGNTPVAISILTTGEVKCMTEITGSIELSTAYKLN